jgi:hypothetical protein
MDKVRIAVPSQKLARLCKRRHIQKLSFFGSVLRADFNAASDIDILVEFEEGHTPGFAFIDVQDELSKIFDGREVDLVTPKFLNRRIKDQIMKEALAVYGA